MWYAKFDKLWLGIILGILAPVITIVIVYLNSFYGFSLPEFIVFLKTMRVFTKLLSLCIIPNLGVFFIFIWSNLMKGARGVLTSTILIAIIIAAITVAQY